MTAVRITYLNNTVTMTWDGSDATAPILVDGVQTGRRTASARHRTPLAVAIACRHAWPEILWPEVPEVGAIPDNWSSSDGGSAWDEVEYETLDETLDSVGRSCAHAMNDAVAKMKRPAIRMTSLRAEQLFKIAAPVTAETLTTLHLDMLHLSDLDTVTRLAISEVDIALAAGQRGGAAVAHVVQAFNARIGK